MPIFDTIQQAIFGPSPTERAEREALLRRFPDMQRRNRALFQRWADMANLAEGQGVSADAMQHINSAAAALEQATAAEATVYNAIKAAIEKGVNDGKLPPTAKHDAGLGFIPLIILIPFIIGFLVGVIIAESFWIVLKSIEPKQAFTAQELNYAEAHGGQLPTRGGTGPFSEAGKEIGKAIGTGAVVIGLIFLAPMLFKRGRRT